MKHILKKFLHEFSIGGDVTTLLDSVPFHDSPNKNLDREKIKDFYGLITTDRNQAIQSFGYALKNKVFFIPEPNPVVIYFDVAQSTLSRIRIARINLFRALETKEDINVALQNSYIYFSDCSVYTTFLFNSLEAFTNLMIPEKFEYKRVLKDKTEIHNKEQVQRNIQFEEKIKYVIPQVTGKEFHAIHAHKFEAILKLKDLRDEIMHTKTYSMPNYYKVLFTKALDFNYEKTIEYCRDYINFYRPNLIEECGCGRED